MASIVSSSATRGHAQADGRAYVRESHKWDDGSEAVVEYGPVPVSVDVQAVATARASRIMEDKAQVEFEELLGGA